MVDQILSAMFISVQDPRLALAQNVTHHHFDTMRSAA
jgi:hypothetical protein